jgi:hypothetical protein
VGWKNLTRAPLHRCHPGIYCRDPLISLLWRLCLRLQRKELRDGSTSCSMGPGHKARDDTGGGDAGRTATPQVSSSGMSRGSIGQQVRNTRRAVLATHRHPRRCANAHDQAHANFQNGSGSGVIRKSTTGALKARSPSCVLNDK